jgi:hypothetical protein
MAERHSKPPDLVVVDAVKDWTCSSCSQSGGGLLIMEDGGPLCMECADMDHLVFLASEDAALTRRAKRASRRSNRQKPSAWPTSRDARYVAHAT